MALDSETLAQFKSTLERYIRDRLLPLEAQVAADDEVPGDIREEMREMGLFGLSIPEEYGGLGLSLSDEMEIAFLLGLASPAFRMVFAANVGIGSQGILMDGTAEQKRAYLPKLASGEFVGAFALTEPEAGSDAASLRTRAARDGEDYILNGTKRFITNAPHADVFTVMARSEPDVEGAGGVSAFIVEQGTPGLSIGGGYKKMGQQGVHVADVIFEDCRVPAANVIGGEPGKGFRTAMKVLDRGRLNLAAVSVGAADRLIEECVNYARERKQFGKPIAEFQLIQAMLADSKADAYAAKCMVRDAARLRDAGEKITLEAACAKLFATEMVGRIADRAVQIFGGAGYVADYPIERFYRDLRIYRIYEGTTQIQQLVIARELLREGG